MNTWKKITHIAIAFQVVHLGFTYIEVYVIILNLPIYINHNLIGIKCKGTKVLQFNCQSSILLSLFPKKPLQLNCKMHGKKGYLKKLNLTGRDNEEHGRGENEEERS